jgi:PAT family acetyl-CoA transporter-like MFS transporter 1
MQGCLFLGTVATTTCCRAYNLYLYSTLRILQTPCLRCSIYFRTIYFSPTDNVKFLKAVEYGLSKSTTAVLSPTIILPLGILVPILATKIWHDRPLRQFMIAYRYRVTLIPFLDVLMLVLLQRGRPQTKSGILHFWSAIILSTAGQAIVSSLQNNAQMTFFAHRVDPAIGGSYMTLLNTAANLGGTWPASTVMWLVSRFTSDPICKINVATGEEQCTGGRDPYFALQLLFSILGCIWIFIMGRTVQTVAELPDEAWRTHLLQDEEDYDPEALKSVDVNLYTKQNGKRE